jgi:hypothetical protein
VSVLVTAAPGLVTASLVAAYSPATTHLRQLGWALLGVSVVTAALVVVASR